MPVRGGKGKGVDLGFGNFNFADSSRTFPAILFDPQSKNPYCYVEPTSTLRSPNISQVARVLLRQ